MAKESPSPSRAPASRATESEKAVQEMVRDALFSMAQSMEKIATNSKGRIGDRLKAIEILLCIASFDHPASLKARSTLSRVIPFLAEIVGSKTVTRNLLTAADLLLRISRINSTR